ncbi:MAG: PilZ domain-containing protein [Myxococcota bacterium]
MSSKTNPLACEVTQPGPVPDVVGGDESIRLVPFVMSNHRAAARPSTHPSSEAHEAFGSGQYALGVGRTVLANNGIEIGLSVCSVPPHDAEIPQAQPGSQKLNAVADERGLLILSERWLPLGTRVALEIRLSEWTRLCVFGHVRWHGGASEDKFAIGIGIAFEELPPATRAQLVAHLGLGPGSP